MEKGGEGGTGGMVKKPRGCYSCSKTDFFPEESFQSWANYCRALRETGKRLGDRITARSLDRTELNEVRARSGHEMRKLSWWDLMWFGVSCVVGAGIFVLTGQEAHDAAGPSVVLSYVVSGVAAMLSVLCYTEFAVEIPVAGGSFAYLRVELGDFIAFIAAGNILLEYIVSCTAVACAWTSYFATLLNHHSDDFRIHIPALSSDYNRLDLIAVAVTATVGLAAIFNTKAASRFNYVACIIHLTVVVFIVIAGLTKADSKNLSDFAPFGARGLFSASAVLFFAYVGFDAVSTKADHY